MLLMQIIIYAIWFIVGACIFSFLNVVVYRVPLKKSFITGRSFCPTCKHELAAKDLIPIISYISIKGKCRYCHTSFSSRDTWVEIMGGIAAIYVAFRYCNPSSLMTMNVRGFLEAATVFAFFCGLTIVGFMDWDTMEIADGFHIYLAIIAVISIFTFTDGPSIKARIIGALCISIPMLVLALFIDGAFGGGDIKLMIPCGFLLGWKIVLVSTIIGLILGAVFGVGLMAAKKAGRKSQFAFGPFLCIGMAIGLLFGETLINWYISFAF